MKYKKIIKVTFILIIAILIFIGSIILIPIINKPTTLVDLCQYDYKISFEISKTCEEGFKIPQINLTEKKIKNFNVKLNKDYQSTYDYLISDIGNLDLYKLYLYNENTTNNYDSDKYVIFLNTIAIIDMIQSVYIIDSETKLDKVVVENDNMYTSLNLGHKKIAESKTSSKLNSNSSYIERTTSSNTLDIAYVDAYICMMDMEGWYSFNSQGSDVPKNILAKYLEIEEEEAKDILEKFQIKGSTLDYQSLTNYLYDNNYFNDDEYSSGLMASQYLESKNNSFLFMDGVLYKITLNNQIYTNFEHIASSRTKLIILQGQNLAGEADFETSKEIVEANGVDSGVGRGVQSSYGESRHNTAIEVLDESDPENTVRNSYAQENYIDESGYIDMNDVVKDVAEYRDYYGSIDNSFYWNY